MSNCYYYYTLYKLCFRPSIKAILQKIFMSFEKPRKNKKLFYLYFLKVQQVGTLRRKL